MLRDTPINPNGLPGPSCARGNVSLFSAFFPIFLHDVRMGSPVRVSSLARGDVNKTAKLCFISPLFFLHERCSRRNVISNKGECLPSDWPRHP